MLAFLHEIEIISLPLGNNYKNPVFHENLLNQILYVVILAPVFEEIIYRLALKYSEINLTVATFFIIYDLTSFFLDVGFYDFNSYLILRIIISFAIALLLLLVLHQNKLIYKKVRCIYNNKIIFLLIFYFQLFHFAFSHLNLFVFENKVLISSIFVMLPYIVMSFFISYTRLKLGILYAIVFHMINNSLPLLSLL